MSIITVTIEQTIAGMITTRTAGMLITKAGIITAMTARAIDRMIAR